MGCECSNISRCQSELNTLNETVLANLSNAASYSGEISGALQKAAGSIGEAIDTSTIHKVKTQLNDFNGQGDAALQVLCDDCDAEIQRLFSLLNQMQENDRLHHEAEAASACE